MQNINDFPITISMPQGFTIGGVTTWALATARHMATPARPVRLIAHPPLAGHATFDPSPALDGANVEVINAPALSTNDGFGACLDLYAALLPTILLPNLCAESYAIAASLSDSRSRDLRVISWIHGDNAIDYAYLEYFEPVVHQYVAVSRQCCTEMQRRLPTRADDIACIPCGITIPPSTVRQSLINQPIRIAYAGRIEQGVKRVVDLLAIALTLANRGRRFNMRIVGDGPHAGMLDARIAALAPRLAELECSLTREPARPPHEMNDVWQWADVSLLTSRLEGLSVSMLEAMAAGCVPVVTQIASGVGETIREDVNGLTFPIGDIQAAAKQLMRVADDPAMLDRLSVNARASAITDACIDRYVERIEPILSGAARNAPRAWPASRKLLPPNATPTHGAVPHNEPCSHYETIIDFIMSRPDATRIVIYGLGVNGLTLIERLRSDAYLGNRTLRGVDDHANAAIFETMELPRFDFNDMSAWPHDTIAVVTPNDPTTIAARLQAINAVPGVDFACLHSICDREQEPKDAASEPVPC